MPALKSARRCASLFLASCLTAASASAAALSRCEVRVGAAAVPGLTSVGAPVAPGAGLSAGTLQAPGLISQRSVSASPAVAPPAELLLPQAPASMSLSAPAAMVPALNIRQTPAPAAPGARTDQALSPERRAQYQSLSSELAVSPGTITPERSRDLGARFFAAPRLLAAPVEGGEFVPAAAEVSASLRPAEPAAPRAPAVGKSVRPAPAELPIPQAPPQAAAARRQSYQPETGLRAALHDRLLHRRLLAHHLYFYSVAHIEDLWPAYQENRRKLAARGEASAVERPRTFFSYMRVMGETGIFYVLGFAALNDQAVLDESRRTFGRFFDGPGVGTQERAAFERFLGRIAVFNKAHRAHSNMKKHIRDALLLASVMPAREIAPFFDSLALQDKTDEIEEFQRQGAPERIKAYREAVQQTLAEEPDTPDRILGVVLMGSFARGAATPTSDMDTEPLAHGGGNGRVQAFNDRLIARWENLGLQQANPITPHEHTLHPSPGLLARVHPNRDFLVFSDDPALEQALAPGSVPAVSPMIRHRTWRGRLGRILEFGTVFAVTCWTDLKRALGR